MSTTTTPSTGTGEAAQSTAPRALAVISREIRANWVNPYFGAVPYIEAMDDLSDINDTYGTENAKDIVLRFLVNARTWRGETARRVKTELKNLATAPRTAPRQ